MEQDKIKEIAGELDCGFRCFIHIKTKEIKTIPNFDQHLYMEEGPWRKDIRELDKHSQDYIEIEGMDSSESFRLRADFAGTVDNDELRKRLIQALNQRKPFQNFKFVIDNSGEYRQKWFRYKDERLMEWVADQLEANNL